MPPPLTTATSLPPSLDDATEDQFVLGALVATQEAPESMEVKIGPPFTAAASLLPSAEEATELQFVMGALVCVQVWPREGLTPVNKPHDAATARRRCFVFMTGLAQSMQPGVFLVSDDVHVHASCWFHGRVCPR